MCVSVHAGVGKGGVLPRYGRRDKMSLGLVSLVKGVHERLSK